ETRLPGTPLDAEGGFLFCRGTNRPSQSMASPARRARRLGHTNVPVDGNGTGTYFSASQQDRPQGRVPMPDSPLASPRSRAESHSSKAQDLAAEASSNLKSSPWARRGGNEKAEPEVSPRGRLSVLQKLRDSPAFTGSLMGPPKTYESPVPLRRQPSTGGERLASPSNSPFRAPRSLTGTEDSTSPSTAARTPNRSKLRLALQKKVSSLRSFEQSITSGSTPARSQKGSPAMLSDS
ncbi:unnamed protein product, partial [Chrysoparadoxa australica]